MLSAGAPSQFSDQVLQRFNLRERFEREPGAALAELHASLDTEGGENRLFALAELSYLHAERAQARPYYLAAAVYAYAFSSAGRASPPRSARPADAPCGRSLQPRADRGAHGAGPQRRSSSPRANTVLPFGRLEHRHAGRRARRGRAVASSDFLPAAHVAVRGLRNRYRQAGLGAPLVAAWLPPRASQVSTASCHPG